MFQKDQEKHLDCKLQLPDGTVTIGKLACGLANSIDNALNNEGAFIKLFDEAGNPRFFAKTQIAMIEPLNKKVPKEPRLRVVEGDKDSWHAILHVNPTASEEEVKTTYHRLAKNYHPDLFPADMPAEMLRYASTMLARINSAYQTFKEIREAA